MPRSLLPSGGRRSRALFLTAPSERPLFRRRASIPPSGERHGLRPASCPPRGSRPSGGRRSGAPFLAARCERPLFRRRALIRRGSGTSSALVAAAAVAAVAGALTETAMRSLALAARCQWPKFVALMSRRWHRKQRPRWPWLGGVVDVILGLLGGDVPCGRKSRSCCREVPVALGCSACSWPRGRSGRSCLLGARNSAKFIFGAGGGQGEKGP